MTANEAFIDANLLVLLVVGLVDRDLVAKHRRTRQFTPKNYDCLLEITERLTRVLVTPNTLTEASNLLKSHKDSRILHKLRILIEQSEEIVVKSAIAARNSKFVQLGLTDAVLLEVASVERPLITTDLPLYAIALSKGKEAAVNFRHLCDLS